MPTSEVTDRFKKDWSTLGVEARKRFQRTVLEQFVPDLAAGRFRAGLRVKRLQATRDIFEMTWAPDGRATWQYGTEQIPDQPHVIWRRVGAHDVFRSL